MDKSESQTPNRWDREYESQNEKTLENTEDSIVSMMENVLSRAMDTIKQEIASEKKKLEHSGVGTSSFHIPTSPPVTCPTIQFSPPVKMFRCFLL
jgi:hypothetical protein